MIHKRASVASITTRLTNILNTRLKPKAAEEVAFHLSESYGAASEVVGLLNLVLELDRPSDAALRRRLAGVYLEACLHMPYHSRQIDRKLLQLLQVGDFSPAGRQSAIVKALTKGKSASRRASRGATAGEA